MVLSDGVPCLPEEEAVLPSEDSLDSFVATDMRLDYCPYSLCMAYSCLAQQVKRLSIGSGNSRYLLTQLAMRLATYRLL